MSKAGPPGIQAAPAAAHGSTRPSIMTPMPPRVTGATKGATSRFAGSPTTLTEPAIRTMTGAHITCAATGMTSASAVNRSGLGRRGRSQAAHGRTNTSRPRVARLDNANPRLRASQGSMTSRTTMAPASAGGPATRREPCIPNRPMAPIAEARNTLGSGRATMTNAHNAIPSTAGRQRRRTPSQRRIGAMAPSVMATLAPLTALKCVRPVAFMSAVRSGGERLVSPMTRPGTSPCASFGKSAIAARRAARGRSDHEKPHGAWCWTTGAPSARTTATTESAGSAGPSRICAVMRSCQANRAQRASATTSTGARTRVDVPRAATCSSRRRTR